MRGPLPAPAIPVRLLVRKSGALRFTHLPRVFPRGRRGATRGKRSRSRCPHPSGLDQCSVGRSGDRSVGTIFSPAHGDAIGLDRIRVRRRVVDQITNRGRLVRGTRPRRGGGLPQEMVDMVMALPTQDNGDVMRDTQNPAGEPPHPPPPRRWHSGRAAVCGGGILPPIPDPADLESPRCGPGRLRPHAAIFNGFLTRL
jgi:hypothetical protein